MRERIREEFAIEYTHDSNAIGGNTLTLSETAPFHILFEAVHPFVDGNGRTGRLLLNFMLMKHGYPPINIKFADRRRYCDAFTAIRFYACNGPSESRTIAS